LIEVVLNVKGRRAFTLVELMVVVVIIGILVAIIIPNVADTIRDARYEHAKDVAHNLVKLVKQYIMDNGVPPSNLNVLFDEGYIEDKSILTSPWGTPYLIDHHRVYTVFEDMGRTVTIEAYWLHPNVASFREKVWSFQNAYPTSEGICVLQDAARVILLSYGTNGVWKASTWEVEMKIRKSGSASAEIDFGDVKLVLDDLYWKVLDKEGNFLTNSEGAECIGGWVDEIRFVMKRIKRADGWYYTGEVNNAFDFEYGPVERPFTKFWVVGRGIMITNLILNDIDFSKAKLR